MTTLTKPYFVTLPNRAALTVAGVDAHGFLQNIISNDIELLASQPFLYAHLLTPQGKFLFDFIISRDGESYVLDCEGGSRADDLLKKLTMYRLRAKLDLTLENDKPVYMVMNTDQPADPRHPQLGHRSFIEPDIEERPFDTWDALRIGLGIPDGSRDMAVEKSTLIESRIEIFHGVSFTKGCYIGQEITARMHNRGLAKKHLITVRAHGAHLPPPGTDILTPEGKLAGEMRSSCGAIGMALLKDETLEALKNGTICPTDLNDTKSAQEKI